MVMDNNQLFINGQALSYALLDQESLAASMSSDRDHSYRFYAEDLTGRQHAVVVTPYRPSMRSLASVTIPDGQTGSRP